MSTKHNEYTIDLLQLQENRDYEYDFRIGKDFFASRENSDVLDCDVDVHLVVRRHHESYELEFACDGELSAPCDRCLDPVSIPVGVDYDVKLKYGEEYDDTSSDDLIIIPYGMTGFDVSPLIYDTLLLTIPLRCVHPEGECNIEMSEVLRRHNNEASDESDEE
ncbi:MAG: DUF177 domain-containing protein [Bacteroides sp.]|nr:DUF177 domain-containing protein [Bacteroidales bacterium]MBD5224123.1 DUF177 domain-containing protein [Bacteroidales bacterium]MBD5302841.1 DUF177 domain-containing protein [Bacteroides sp.]MBD5304840.1 DUF177 domain-containing protein [Bacteroides sp.]MBD5348088.1 DUF177 domain-containing protein [Bacteroides sp.]